VTNADLVRLEAGDTGTPTRDAADGDGATTEFYVSSAPIRASSALVYVGGTLKTLTSDYSLDLASGRIVFGTAPVTGTANIVVTYTSVQMSDDDIANACTLAGCASGGTPQQGDKAPILAAIYVCQWLASRYAQDYDVTVEGQDLKRSQMHAMYTARADALRTRYSATSSIVPIPMRRIDGYEQQDITTREVNESSYDPKRRYFPLTVPDRLP